MIGIVALGALSNESDISVKSGRGIQIQVMRDRTPVFVEQLHGLGGILIVAVGIIFPRLARRGVIDMRLFTTGKCHQQGGCHYCYR